MYIHVCTFLRKLPPLTFSTPQNTYNLIHVYFSKCKVLVTFTRIIKVLKIVQSTLSWASHKSAVAKRNCNVSEVCIRLVRYGHCRHKQQLRKWVQN